MKGYYKLSDLNIQKEIEKTLKKWDDSPLFIGVEKKSNSNMKQNTALQELIEWVNSKTQLFVPSKGQIIEKATELLKKEEEQIKQSYGDGLNAHRTNFCNRDEYFNQTYNNNG